MNVVGEAPFLMAQATVVGETPCTPPVPTLLSANPSDSEVKLAWSDESADPAVTGYRVYYDQAGKAQLIAEAGMLTTYIDMGITNGQEYCCKVTSLDDCFGDGSIIAESGFSNILCETPTNPGQALLGGVSAMQTGKWVTTGNGKNQTTEFVVTNTFNAGDEVVVQAQVTDEGGSPLAGATVEIEIWDAGANPVAVLLTGPSGATGWADAAWATEAPRKKGQGGTPAGTYEAVTVNMTVSGYVWDGVMTSTLFNIQ